VWSGGLVLVFWGASARFQGRVAHISVLSSPAINARDPVSESARELPARDGPADPHHKLDLQGITPQRRTIRECGSPKPTNPSQAAEGAKACWNVH